MEAELIPLHVIANLLFGLYLIVRLILTGIWSYKKKDKPKARKVMRKVELFFLILILLPAVYLTLVLQFFELYHLAKLLLIASIIWAGKTSLKRSALGQTFVILILFVSAFALGINKAPVFSKNPSPSSQEATPDPTGRGLIARGKIVFNETCAQCHGEDGKKGRFNAADLSISSITMEQRLDIIKNGSTLTVMRAFKNELTDQDIQAVAQYVESLKEK